MKFTSINKLKENLLEWIGLILYDIDDLVHFVPEKRSDTLRQIVNDALRKYEQTYPIVFYNKKIPSVPFDTEYYFKSNFDDYLAGKILEQDIMLKPSGVYFIRGWGSVNSQWFRFNPDNCSIRIRTAVGNLFCSYFSAYPTVWNKDPAGNWTDDTGIYFLDVYENDVFRKFLTYYFLRHAVNISKSIKMPGEVTYLENLNDFLIVAKEEMELMVKSRTHIYTMWRK